MNKDILNLEEVADYLRVSERTIYEWAKKGELPAGKIGNSWRFKREDIEKWVNSRLSAQKSTKPEQSVVLKEIFSLDRIQFLKTETKEEKQKQKKLESLANDYFQQTGRGYSAERGTGQFIPDENKAAVAKKAYDSAMIIAQTYVDAGGKWEDLGLEDPNKKVDELPEGLTQIDIDHNMKKYNKTREEVIAKFLEGKK